MSKLVILSGVPGSGKSYFSNLVKMTNFNHVYIVSSDKLRNLLTGNQQDLSSDPIMWKMFYELPKIYSLDKESIVIMDATAISEKYRVDANINLKKYFDETILVFFEISKDIIDKQNLNRDFPIPQVAIDYYFKNIQKPSKIDEEFFDKILIIKDNNFLKIVSEL
jgi:tRNA uridine 5-carbamoylmethylation protein Kti12